ncbi:putative RNA polymerase sigma (70) factor [Microbacterium sp. HM58-2]|nr:putative RNA polymerase sigma (70) factor [Microbacterium sp. HM58-2]
MPRDPVELIEWFRGTLTGTEPENMDSAIVWSIVETLELNAAPPDLRAALYQALDLMPGLELLSAQGSVVTLGFRPVSPLDWRETVTIDRATGLLIASTRTFGEGSPIVLDDVPNFRLTNTISVVDSAP